MKRLLQGLLLSSLLIMLFGCESTSMNPFNWGNGGYWRGTHGSQPVPQECNHRAAYAAGVEDARQKRQMKMDFGRHCPYDQSTLSLLYRQGFENGALARLDGNVEHPRWYTEGASGPKKSRFTHNDSGDDAPVEKMKLKPYDPTKWHCFPDQDGNKVCGFYCQRASGKVKCTGSKSQRCVKNEKGDLACGYNCTSTAKTAKCGQTPEEKCLSDAYGNVQCGDDCFRKDGQVICN